VAGVRVGGQPGENPTVLIGTIFYEGHKIVSDPVKGLFDRGKAEELVSCQDELSDETGNPCMLDVVGRTAEALKKYVEFASEATDSPILVDSPLAEARLEACKHAVEVGLGERIVYNSINPEASREEIEKIRDIGLKAAIVLAFSEYEFEPEDKMRILQGNDGLIAKAEKAGIEKVLVDLSVLDVASIAYTAASIQMVKEKLGLPSGCSPANAFDTWRKAGEFKPQVKRACLAALNVFVRCFGADFILYGPVEAADTVFPSCAAADAILTYSLVTGGYEVKDKNTPLYKIL